MDSSKLRAVLLDLDGVVAESMDYHVAAWQEAFGRYGLEVPAEVLYLNEGSIAVETVRSLNSGRIGARQAEDIFRLQKSIFETRYLPRVNLYPDTAAFLEGLRRAGIEAALVSGSSEQAVMGILRPGVRCYFSVVICGESCERPKPHPDPYLAALGSLGLEAAVCAAVENSPAGIAAARSAGLTCYALATTLEPGHLSEAECVFGSLGELGRHLGLP